MQGAVCVCVCLSLVKTSAYGVWNKVPGNTQKNEREGKKNHGKNLRECGLMPKVETHTLMFLCVCLHVFMCVCLSLQLCVCVAMPMLAWAHIWMLGEM